MGVAGPGIIGSGDLESMVSEFVGMAAPVGHPAWEELGSCSG